MPNLYVGLETLKRAADIAGSDTDALLLAHIESASREADNLTNRCFIPITATRRFSWPQPDARNSYILYLDEDLLDAAPTLTKDGDDATAIASTDFFTEPANFGPPYSWIEIDLASSAFFSAKDTHQRAIRVTGSWGYSNATVAAGALAEALDASETAIDVTDSGLIDIGHTILIESEQMYVSVKALKDTTANTAGALTADASETTVAVDNGALVKAGEVITVNSEWMYVASISGNNLTVVRAYNGSTLAAHNNTQDVYAPRTLTVTRGANGTTAATHGDTTAIARYAPPADIVEYVKAQAISDWMAERGGWTGTVGGAEATINITQRGLNAMRDRIQHHYQRRLVGAV